MQKNICIATRYVLWDTAVLYVYKLPHKVFSLPIFLHKNAFHAVGVKRVSFAHHY